MKLIFILEATGMNLEVYEERFAISPKGILGFLSKGTTAKKEIPYDSISAIEFKEAGFAAGYLQFTIAGGNERTGGMINAYSDENTLTFGGALEGGNDKKNALAREIKSFIEEKMRASRRPTSALSLAEEISKLKELHDNGVLSIDEFSAAKAKLIS
jgi:hypothetical protein